MSTGALQHLLARFRRWYAMHTLRSRTRSLTLLIDELSRNVSDDMTLLIDLRAERQLVQRRLALIERSIAAAHGRPVSEA